MRGWARSLAITACLLIVTVLFGALLFLLLWQLNEFGKDAPAVITKLSEPLQQFKSWLAASFGVTTDSQTNLNENLSVSVAGILKSMIQGTVNLVVMLF